MIFPISFLKEGNILSGAIPSELGEIIGLEIIDLGTSKMSKKISKFLLLFSKSNIRCHGRRQYTQWDDSQ